MINKPKTIMNQTVDVRMELIGHVNNEMLLLQTLVCPNDVLSIIRLGHYSFGSDLYGNLLFSHPVKGYRLF
jgi:hypothetical protein